MQGQTRRSLQRAMRGGFNAAPLLRELPADTCTPVAAFLRLAKKDAPGFLLESVEGGERMARYSFLGIRPFLTLESKGGRLRAFHEDGSVESVAGHPFYAIGEFLSRYRAAPQPGLPRFCGGAVGYVAYEMMRHMEPSVRLCEPPDGEARLMLFRDVVAFDRLRHRMLLMANVITADGTPFGKAYRRACDSLDEMEEALKAPLKEKTAGGRNVKIPFSPSMSRSAFERGVRRLKRHIRAGDIFQGVLSARFEAPLRAEPFAVYRALRAVNPSPYMFYIGMGGGDAALGASPEMLLRVDNGVLETRPIAGTRRRGANEEEDRRMEQQLMASAKERAEHLMLVDLGRNDLGRVARPGSVHVPSFMQVERYSHVMHIVSSVRGKLARGRSPWEAFAACFPAGTVTGAPKIRAMQLLAELEPVPRGLYAGAVVYCDFRGNLDSAIAIRGMQVRGKGAVRRAWIQAGAGVVADSHPAREWDEVCNKARAMTEALRLAEERA